MRKRYKVMAGLLVGGILLAGVGSGIAFAEYSEFEYGGEKTLENSEYITKTLDYKVPKDMIKNQVVHMDIPDHYWSQTVEEDASVPKDSIRIEVEYLTDQKDITPQMNEQIMTDIGSNMKYLQLDCGYYYRDMHDFMRGKDIVLADLKNHTLSDYKMDGIQKIRIFINPKADFVLDTGADFFDRYYRSDGKLGEELEEELEGISEEQTEEEYDESEESDGSLEDVTTTEVEAIE